MLAREGKDWGEAAILRTSDAYRMVLPATRRERMEARLPASVFQMRKILPATRRARTEARLPASVIRRGRYCQPP